MNRRVEVDSEQEHNNLDSNRNWYQNSTWTTHGSAPRILLDCGLVGEKQKNTRTPARFILPISYIQGNVRSKAREAFWKYPSLDMLEGEDGFRVKQVYFQKLHEHIKRLRHLTCFKVR